MLFYIHFMYVFVHLEIHTTNMLHICLSYIHINISVITLHNIFNNNTINIRTILIKI